MYLKNKFKNLIKISLSPLGTRFTLLRKKVFNKNLRTKYIFQDYFIRTKSIYIHIPKTAGTSISSAIYGKDPWHHRIRDFEKIDKMKLDQFFKFAFVREPSARLLSTYNYALSENSKRPGHILSFCAEYKNFDDFVNKWLSKKNIYSHYFFWPQAEYLLDSNKNLNLDFIGKFENLHEDFDVLCEKLNLETELPRLNVSKNRYKQEISNLTLEKIKLVYSDDYKLFNY